MMFLTPFLLEPVGVGYYVSWTLLEAMMEEKYKVNEKAIEDTVERSSVTVKSMESLKV